MSRPGSSLLPILSAASGCAALIYEIVWFQLLQLVIGSTAVSLGVLLAAFMGGLCLGSVLFPRVIFGQTHTLRVFAWIELGIGVLGAAVWVGLPGLDGIYAASAAHGWPSLALRGGLCALCLLPPTLLMGASLPALARALEASPEGVSKIGLIYGCNIAGAVAGCLLAGFYLLRVYDTGTATWCAAAINIGAAALAAGLAWRAPPLALASEDARSAGSAPLLIAIALSGMSALGAEVVWTRLLSLMLGATVYTFSIILAVFLVGLGTGSIAASYLLRTRLAPRVALVSCQVLLAVAILWSAWMVARVLPYWRMPLWAATPAGRFTVDAARTLLAILPATCLWGASFPLALAAAARPGQDPAWLVGRLYAANTLGAIAGALGFSIFQIPFAGTQNSQRLLIAVSVLAAAAAAGPLVRGLGRSAAAMLVVLAAGLAVRSVPAVPWGVFAYGRQLPDRKTLGTPLYVGEGMNSTIAVSESYDTRLFHVSGKVEASSEAQDMRVQRMLGHMPALFHPRPRSVLVVGCGAGVTAGSFVLHPEVERIVICEIEPLVAVAALRFFAPENHNVLRDPRVKVVYDDARHYILTTPEKFDVITSDPIHPWVRGSAALYTKEYFELCRRRLAPGGIVAQWVPLYESDRETVKSEVATFFSIFPNGTIWANDTIFAEGYDTVLMGWAGQAGIDIGGLEERLRRPDHAGVLKSLKQVGLGSTVSLLSTYAGQGPDLQRWLKHAQINRDRNLRLQYLAGMNPDARGATSIYVDILRFRRYPERLFQGLPESQKPVRDALR